MDLRSVRHPVGPHPSGVYWRRRALVLVVLAVLVVLLSRACGAAAPQRTAGGGGAPTSPATTAPATPSITAPAAPATTSPSSPATTGTPTAAGAGRCAPAALAVTAVTDATDYPAGVLPHLTITVRNTGGSACTIDWGPAVRTLTVYSGSDRIWGSADCPQPQSLVSVPLAPGGTTSAGLVWPRHRSAPGCTDTATAALPGTYRLYAGFAGLVSGPAVFRLTS